MVSDSNFPSPPQVFCQMVLVKSKSDFYLVAIKLLGIFLFSVGPHQHVPYFPGSPAPMLASTSRQSLCSPSGHANTVRIIPVRRRPCWRRPPRKAFALRPAAPTPKGKEPKSMQYKTRGKRSRRFPLALFLQKFVCPEIIQR